jgi:hypothetical protein
LKALGFVVAVGVVLGIAMVWWVEPATSAGAVFVVVATALVCFVSSVALNLIRGLFRKSPSKKSPSNKTKRAKR